MFTRRLIAATLTLILLITSGTVAVSRGHMASMAMLHVLCIDGEVQVVAIGQDGAPLEDHRSCADCVIGALLSLDGARNLGDYSYLAGTTEPAMPPALQVQPSTAKAALARAPPSSV
ncbi:MAG: hypothetical protein AAGF50_14425 [Pseudomonadota bacterium]